MSRIFNNYHIEASKQFLASKKILRIQNKNVCDLTDNEVVQFCHYYCEDNNLISEFNAFQDAMLSDYCYCELIDCGFTNKGAYISKDLCNDIQLCCADLKSKSDLLEQKQIDWEKSNCICLKCEHNYNL